MKQSDRYTGPTRLDDVQIRDVAFTTRTLRFTLTDGRVLRIPLKWFPVLARESKSRSVTYGNCSVPHTLSPDKAGVYFPSIDEDISVRVLMGHWS